MLLGGCVSPGFDALGPRGDTAPGRRFVGIFIALRAFHGGAADLLAAGRGAARPRGRAMDARRAVGDRRATGTVVDFAAGPAMHGAGAFRSPA